MKYENSDCDNVLLTLRVSGHNQLVSLPRLIIKSILQVLPVNVHTFMHDGAKPTRNRNLKTFLKLIESLDCKIA